MTGSWVTPRSVIERRQSGLRTSASKSGKRRSSAPSAICASRRASAAPRQKCDAVAEREVAVSRRGRGRGGRDRRSAPGRGWRRRAAATHELAARGCGRPSISQSSSGDAVGRLHRAVVAQELLDGAGRSARDRRCRRSRSPGWRSSASDGVADQVGGRLVAGAEDQAHRRQQLGLARALSPCSSAATSALIRSSRGARRRASKIAAEVGGDLVEGALGLLEAAGAVQRVEQHGEVVGPALEAWRGPRRGTPSSSAITVTGSG